jgi:ribosome-binding factor A
MGRYRNKRVADEIKRIISDIFAKDLQCNEFGLVTVTKVVCSQDIKQAKIYVSIYNDDSGLRSKSIKNIKSKSSYIRGLLGNRLRVRYVPEIKFVEDDSSIYADKIEKLIDKMKE